MFGMSGEHLLVLLVILLIFGPRRLPELGHSIGRTLKNFKDGMNNQMEQNTSVPAAAPRAQTASAGPVTPVTATMTTPAEGPASAQAQAAEITPEARV